MPNETAVANPPVELRHRLRIAREYASLDQTELAELMCVSRSTISNAERGHGATRKIVINAWSNATGVSKQWLLTGADA